MEISKRLMNIVNMADRCSNVIDVGTDHGYVPIYMVKNNICDFAVASDINKGPVEKAKMNVTFSNLSHKIQCRKGPGLSTVKKGEVDAAIIAGMGGNLTRDIICEDIEIVKELKYMILQPAQNPEVLRKFLYEKGFRIIDEDLCFDEGKYYEFIKVSYGENITSIEDPIYYEISPILIKKKHPLLKEYINNKIEKSRKVVKNLKDDTENSLKRRSELINYINKLEEILTCL